MRSRSCRCVAGVCSISQDRKCLPQLQIRQNELSFSTCSVDWVFGKVWHNFARLLLGPALAVSWLANPSASRSIAISVFFLCWSILLLAVIPFQCYFSIRNNILLPAHQHCSGSVLHHVCYHWAPSAASVLKPAMSTAPASSEICHHDCPLPALYRSRQNLEEEETGHGEFGRAPSHHFDFKIWSQRRRACRLQFTSFLVDGSSGGLQSVIL